jgi:hypothetical protein
MSYLLLRWLNQANTNNQRAQNIIIHPQVFEGVALFGDNENTKTPLKLGPSLNLAGTILETYLDIKPPYNKGIEKEPAISARTETR